MALRSEGRQCDKGSLLSIGDGFRGMLIGFGPTTHGQTCASTDKRAGLQALAAFRANIRIHAQRGCMPLYTHMYTGEIHTSRTYTDIHTFIRSYNHVHRQKHNYVKKIKMQGYRNTDVHTRYIRKR